MHAGALFLVVGFKSWFEFKVVCCLIWFGERIWKCKRKRKKKKDNQTTPATAAGPARLSAC
jgi:hypothetical protein